MSTYHLEKAERRRQYHDHGSLRYGHHFEDKIALD